MKRKSILTLTTFLAITLLFAAFASYKYVPYAQAICGIERGCFDDGVYNTCIPTPTTLPAVDVTDVGDWHVSNSGSHCGAKRCYYMFACECGPPLGDRLCTSEEKRNA